MALTAQVSLSNSSVTINETISVTVAVTNDRGSAAVDVGSVQMNITPNPSVIGKPSVSIASPTTIPAGETRYFPVGAVAFAPSKPGTSEFAYVISALVYQTDGTGIAATSATVQVSPPDAVMPAASKGQLRLDSNLDSYMILLLAV
jgi:hypothetical protein